MFFRDLRHKPGKAFEVQLANVHMPVKLGHRDANKLFAEPLNAQLAAAALGTVIDCRRRVRTSGLVSGVDIYLGLTSSTTETLLTVTKMLELLSAPCGSSIRLADGVGNPILFGRTEGLELSVDSNIAPNADSRRDLAMACKGAIETIGVSRGWNINNERTNFYFYGESFSEMRARLNKILGDHPRYDDAMLRRVA